MTNFIVHEINCEDKTAVYREASEEESMNIAKLHIPSVEPDEKFNKLKEAAKLSSPELYEFVCYVLGVSDANSE
jgi:hypothetical protein